MILKSTVLYTGLVVQGWTKAEPDCDAVLVSACGNGTSTQFHVPCQTMMDANDYTTAWIVYLCAAGVFSLMSWGILRRLPLRSLAFLLQCWLLALLFTPWQVQPDVDLMAPAFIVLALDLITIEPQAAIRALIPLVLSLALGLVVAICLSIIDGMLRRRSRNRKKPAPTRSRRPPQRAPVREPTLGDGEV